MIECRKAVPGDAFLLAATRCAVWRETYRGIYADEQLDHYDLEAQAQRDARQLADSRHHCYLFMDGLQCAGYFSYGPSNFGPYKDFALCLNQLYIRNGYKGQGLGRSAFQHLRAYCAQQGIGAFFCGCNIHNTPAVGFYRHMDGVEGDLPSPHPDPADDIISFDSNLVV